MAGIVKQIEILQITYRQEFISKVFQKILSNKNRPGLVLK